jgi:hypothetical protein
MMVVDTWWDTILGNQAQPGYDMEIISGLKDGVGIDNVGAGGRETFAVGPRRGTQVIVKLVKLRL